MLLEAFIMKNYVQKKYQLHIDYVHTLISLARSNQILIKGFYIE